MKKGTASWRLNSSEAAASGRPGSSVFHFSAHTVRPMISADSASASLYTKIEASRKSKAAYVKEEIGVWQVKPENVIIFERQRYPLLFVKRVQIYFAFLTTVEYYQLQLAKNACQASDGIFASERRVAKQFR